jgi:two-component system cell cycle sensor histidine kinase/response regulator CckA
MPEGNIDMFKEKFNKSIRFKFLSIISVILFVSTLVLSLVVAINAGRVLKNSLMTTGQSFASYIAKLSRDPLIMKDSIQLDAIVNDANKDENIAYTIIRDEQGAPLTSQYASINYRLPRLNAILSGLSRDNELQDIIDAIKKKEPVVEISVPVMIDIKTIGAVTIGMSKHEMHQQIVKTILFVVALNVAVAFVLGAVLFVASKKIVFNPLIELAHASSRLAKGDLSTEVKVRTTGEVKTLVNSFNEMVKNLAKVTVSKNYVDNIIRSMINTLIVVSPDGKIIRVNDATCKLLGYEEEELIGQPAETIFGGERSSKDSLMKTIFTDGNVSNLEESYRAKNGDEFSVSFSASVMRDENNQIRGTVCVAQDITERKRAEQEMAALQEQLRQSQKMEAIGKLAGGIAHDFNNLLTVIKGYNQLSLLELKKDDPLRANIEVVQKAAERAANLTRHILAFSRRQILEFKVFDLNHLVLNLDKMLRRVIGEDIELVTLLSEDLGKVKSDSGQIEQVFMNLAVNAKDAMPKGGKLTIETANVELDENYAQTHAGVTPGRYVMLAVSDTGVGMTPEVKEKIFEPFFTTKEMGKGTGLGLSTVYGIVKQSGGNIWVYSEPGHGTTLKVYLPRVDESVEELREKEVREEIPRGSETILVVENEEPVRKLAVRVLQGQGYRVLDASQGDDALLIFKQHQGPIHMMVTDMVMPGMNGLELAKCLESFNREIKVLYMSGYADNAIVRHNILESGMPYIQKPFTEDALRRKVREVLNK